MLLIKRQTEIVTESDPFGIQDVRMNDLVFLQCLLERRVDESLIRRQENGEKGKGKKRHVRDPQCANFVLYSIQLIGRSGEDEEVVDDTRGIAEVIM